MLEVDYKTEGERAVLKLRGELDLTSSVLLEEGLARAEREAGTVVVDLSELAFMDSSGLRALITANRRAANGAHELLLVPAPPHVQRIFEVTQLESLFRFDPEAGTS